VRISHDNVLDFNIVKGTRISLWPLKKHKIAENKENRTIILLKGHKYFYGL
jgi:hypothetical protein